MLSSLNSTDFMNAARVSVWWRIVCYIYSARLFSKWDWFCFALILSSKPSIFSLKKVCICLKSWFYIFKMILPDCSDMMLSSILTFYFLSICPTLISWDTLSSLCLILLFNLLIKVNSPFPFFSDRGNNPFL